MNEAAEQEDFSEAREEILIHRVPENKCRKAVEARNGQNRLDNANETM
jgi:hypothetical protein